MKRSIVALVALLASACAPIKPVPPTPVPTPAKVGLNWTVTSGDQAQTVASLMLDSGVGVPWVQSSPGRYGLVLEGATGGSTQYASAPGYLPFSQRLHLVTADLLRLQPSLVSDPASDCTESPIPSVSGAYEVCPAVALIPSLPAPPTRWEALTAQSAMYGLMCDSPTLGGHIPWWDPGIQAIADPAERAAIFRCKSARGDTSIITGPGLLDTVLYDEPGNPYQVPIHPFDIAARVAEYARAGFRTTDLYLDGDGDQMQRAFDEFPVVYQKLLQGGPPQGPNDLNRFVKYRPGWDGVFYSCTSYPACWTTAKIVEWGAMARGICPYCVLTLEFNTGHIPCGEGGGDFLPGGCLKDYDGVLVEFNVPGIHDDNTWQIMARLLGPQYLKPPDDPNGGAPWYASTPSARGPWGVECFEPPTYDWVRLLTGRTTQQIADENRAYLKALGCFVVD